MKIHPSLIFNLSGNLVSLASIWKLERAAFLGFSYMTAIPNRKVRTLAEFQPTVLEHTDIRQESYHEVPHMYWNLEGQEWLIPLPETDSLSYVCLDQGGIPLGAIIGTCGISTEVVSNRHHRLSVIASGA